MILQKYKDIWYGSFISNSMYSDSFMWVISDTQGMYFNGSNYRIDQCIEIFKNECIKSF